MQGRVRRGRCSQGRVPLHRRKTKTSGKIFSLSVHLEFVYLFVGNYAAMVLNEMHFSIEVEHKTILSRILVKFIYLYTGVKTDSIKKAWHCLICNMHCDIFAPTIYNRMQYALECSMNDQISRYTRISTNQFYGARSYDSNLGPIGPVIILNTVPVRSFVQGLWSRRVWS